MKKNAHTSEIDSEIKMMHHARRCYEKKKSESISKIMTGTHQTPHIGQNFQSQNENMMPSRLQAKGKREIPIQTTSPATRLVERRSALAGHRRPW
jgi:hypothetical protein